MTAQISIYGRLGGDPRSIDTTSGKPMTVASVAVDVGERNVEDPAPEWFGIVAFGRHAEALAKHAKGECVAVSGRIQRNRFTDRNGNERVQLQVVADNLVSARTVRPGGGGRKAKPAESEPAPEAEAAPANGGEDFDDDIPF